MFYDTYVLTNSQWRPVGNKPLQDRRLAFKAFNTLTADALGFSSAPVLIVSNTNPRLDNRGTRLAAIAASERAKRTALHMLGRR